MEGKADPALFDWKLGSARRLARLALALEACGSRRLLGEAFAGVSAVDRKLACQIALVAACQSLRLKAK